MKKCAVNRQRVSKTCCVKRLERSSCKGKSHQFKKDGVPYIITIPIHGNKVLGVGLEKKILKDIGLKEVFMLKSYPAIFHKEDDGSFWVEFPGFGGGTEGDDVEEAMKNAREMLESSLAAYLDEGLELPKVVDMSELSVEDGFITLIQADPSPYLKSTKAIRKNVTVPEWLVRLADRENVNYSEVLTQALEKKLQL